MNLIKFRRDNDLFSDTFRTMFNHPFFSMKDEMMNTTSFTPKVRISEDKDNFYLNLEMPGIPKDDVKILHFSIA